MALTHLVDTSVLTRLGRAEVVDALAVLTEQGLVARCTLSDLEIGYSARNTNEWDALRESLHIFTPIDITSTDVARGLETQRGLAGCGLKGRKVPDLIIAAVAQRMNLTLLHYDRDFELIAELTGQPSRWLVERGSID